MPRPPRLSPEDVTAALAELPNWSGGTDGLERTFTRVDLQQAADMLGELAVIAEELDHHPDVDVRWRTMRIFLVSHSAGGVTELDVQFARRVDELFDLASPEDQSPELQAALDRIDKSFGKARQGGTGQPDSGA
jgi:4a-hydroxytetrahydrobiopterin dehydratase